jgi:hypothetical protein
MKQIRENLFAIVRLRGSSDVVLEAEEITRIEGLKQEYEARMMK